MTAHQQYVQGLFSDLFDAAGEYIGKRGLCANADTRVASTCDSPACAYCKMVKVSYLLSKAIGESDEVQDRQKRDHDHT